MEDIDLRIRNGVDKITLNTVAIEHPQLIKDASERYGSQCVVISVDYKSIAGVLIVLSNFGTLLLD